MKPPVKINTLRDLKLYLNFNLEGSYGFWIDREGIINIVVPRAAYKTIASDLVERLPSGAQVRILKQSLLSELRLLWERFKGWRHDQKN